MPATGAIARTAVNVRAGARTRVATLTHAIVLVLVVFFGAGLVSRIPLAALAGVLMVTAVRMVDVANVRAVLRATRSDAVVFVLTAAATIAFDLIVAVEIGVAVAVVLALRPSRTSEVELEPLDLTETVTDDGSPVDARAHRRLSPGWGVVLRRRSALPRRADPVTDVRS
jgi:SulP family sulfate permease